MELVLSEGVFCALTNAQAKVQSHLGRMEKGLM
jgi:hypothetical protein